MFTNVAHRSPFLGKNRDREREEREIGLEHYFTRRSLFVFFKGFTSEGRQQKKGTTFGLKQLDLLKSPSHKYQFRCFTLG